MADMQSVRFVVCIDNGTDEADLEVRKIYEALHDDSADAEGLIRVIDDSGEDFLYPAQYFRPIDLPRDLQALLARAS